MTVEKAREELEAARKKAAIAQKKVQQWEAKVTELENLEYIKIIRAERMSISEVQALIKNRKTFFPKGEDQHEQIQET